MPPQNASLANASLTTVGAASNQLLTGQRPAGLRSEALAPLSFEARERLWERLLLLLLRAALTERLRLLLGDLRLLLLLLRDLRLREGLRDLRLVEGLRDLLRLGEGVRDLRLGEGLQDLRLAAGLYLDGLLLLLARLTDGLHLRLQLMLR